MATPDLLRIKNNVAKMVSMNAPESDIDSYIKEEGTTIDEIRNYKFQKSEPTTFNKIQTNLSRPGAAVRGFLLNPFGQRTEMAVKGFREPESIPTFQELGAREASRAASYLPRPLVQPAAFIGSSLAQLGGLSLDLATDPLVAGTGVAGKYLSSIPRFKQFGQATSKALVQSKVGQEFGKFLTKERHLPEFNMSETIKKFKAGYINDELFPRAEKVYTQAINRFDEGAKQFAEDIGKVSHDVSSHIFKRKPQAIINTVDEIGDSPAVLSRMIEDTLDANDLALKQDYKEIFSLAGDKDLFNINRTFDLIKSELKKVKYLNEFGKPRKNLTRMEEGNRTLRYLFKTYNDLVDQSVSSRQPFVASREFIKQGRKVDVGINKHQLILFRDELTDLYKAEPGQRGLVKRILNKLHDDAERGGLKGIRQARDKFFENLQDRERASSLLLKKSLAGKSPLDNIFNIEKNNPKVFDDLRYFEQKYKLPLIEPAKDIVAAKEFSRLNDVIFKERQILSKIKFAESPQEFNRIKSQFIRYFGKSPEMDSIFQDLIGFRRIGDVKSLGARPMFREFGRFMLR